MALFCCKPTCTQPVELERTPGHSGGHWHWHSGTACHRTTGSGTHWWHTGTVPLPLLVADTLAGCGSAGRLPVAVPWRPGRVSDTVADTGVTHCGCGCCGCTHIAGWQWHCVALPNHRHPTGRPIRVTVTAPTGTATGTHRDRRTPSCSPPLLPQCQWHRHSHSKSS